MSGHSELSLDVEQLIDARPDTVFGLLTDPVLYARWFGPEGAEVHVDSMEVVLGGRLALRITFPGTDIEVAIEGFYEVVEPPHHLTHTWRAADEELVTTVAFDLEPVGDRTMLRVHHRGFVDPVDLEQNRGGWVDHIAVLGVLAAESERSAP